MVRRCMSFRDPVMLRWQCPISRKSGAEICGRLIAYETVRENPFSLIRIEELEIDPVIVAME